MKKWMKVVLTIAIVISLLSCVYSVVMSVINMVRLFTVQIPTLQGANPTSLILGGVWSFVYTNLSVFVSVVIDIALYLVVMYIGKKQENVNVLKSLKEEALGSIKKEKSAE